MLTDARHCTLPGSPISHDGHTRHCVFITLPSALSIRLTTSRRISADLTFIENSEVLVASGCHAIAAFSWLSEVGDRSKLYLCVTIALGMLHRVFQNSHNRVGLSVIFFYKAH